MWKIINLHGAWVEFCITVINQKYILLKYQWMCKLHQIVPTRIHICPSKCIFATFPLFSMLLIEYCFHLPFSV